MPADADVNRVRVLVPVGERDSPGVVPLLVPVPDPVRARCFGARYCAIGLSSPLGPLSSYSYLVGKTTKGNKRRVLASQTSQKGRFIIEGKLFASRALSPVSERE